MIKSYCEIRQLEFIMKQYDKQEVCAATSIQNYSVEVANSRSPVNG